MRRFKEKDQPQTSLSLEFTCEHCQELIRHLTINNKVWDVQEILPPVYCTDAHENLIGVNLHLAPFYTLHAGLCHPNSPPTNKEQSQNGKT